MTKAKPVESVEKFIHVFPTALSRFETPLQQFVQHPVMIVGDSVGSEIARLLLFKFERRSNDDGTTTLLG
jgi:hypothetical protein